MALFGTTISLSLTVLDAATTITLALGSTTMVLCTLSTNITINGVTTTGGTNVDGAVFTLQNITGSFTLSTAHNGGSPATSGFLNVALTTGAGGVGYGALTYRYLASANRWMHIGST